MPELRPGKQFLYRLIVSQLQQDGFVNVATSLSIATIGQTKIIPSDRLHNLISLCAKVVRDTDAEVVIEEKENSPSSSVSSSVEQNGEVDKDHLVQQSSTESTGDQQAMGAQQSAFHPALTQFVQSQVLSVKEEELENKNLTNKDEDEISAAALKNLHHLQMLKVFSNMTEATRQACLQSQALQRKPFYMSPSPPAPQPGNGNVNSKEPVRPFPLSTPDIKTPRCRSTLLPFTGTTVQEQSNIFSNGDQEIKVENTQNIHAMEEIIKLTEDKGCLPAATPTSIPSTSSGIPLNFLQTESAIQELIVQRQLKQRRFKDLDCSFVSKLIQQPSLVNNIVNSGEGGKPKIDFNSVLSRLSSSSEHERKLSQSPPSSLASSAATVPVSSAGTIVDELLSTTVGLGASGGASSSGDQARYECPRCARVFAYEYVLQTHMRQVCPDRSNYKHPCGVCKKRFQNQSSLKRHMIVHTGERKYECEVCHKRFGRSHHLKRHVKIHEMEAANYSQHHPGQEGSSAAGTIPEETLQLILQLGAINKFPGLSAASLIDSAIAEDMLSNCDSIEDGDSQGDVDMEDGTPSDAGEISVEVTVNEEKTGGPTTSALSIQNILNNTPDSALRFPEPTCDVTSDGISDTVTSSNTMPQITLPLKPPPTQPTI